MSTPSPFLLLHFCERHQETDCSIDIQGETALMQACDSSSCSPYAYCTHLSGVVEALLASGASVDARDAKVRQCATVIGLHNVVYLASWSDSACRHQ